MLQPSGDEEAVVTTPSPRKRRVKTPPETTPTRLRQAITMTAGVPAGILGQQRSRKTLTSPTSPDSPFVSPTSAQDKLDGPGVSGVPLMSITSAEAVGTQEDASESSTPSKPKAPTSVQGDANRLTPTAFNAPSREVSMPPIMVNGAYGSAPAYYGSMQPQASPESYFRPYPPSPNPAAVPLGAAEALNPLQGLAAAPGVAHNMPYRYGAPYGYYSMHVPGGPWPNHHVDPLFSTSPIPSMLNLAPDNIPAATSTATATYRSTSQSLDVPRSSTLVDARPLPTEPIPSMSNLAPDNTPAATSAATATYRSTLQSLDVPRGSTLVDAWPLPTEPMSTEQASIDIGLRLPPPQGLRNSEGVKMAGNSPPR
jgi:hypothetical protein